MNDCVHEIEARAGLRRLILDDLHPEHESYSTNISHMRVIGKRCAQASEEKCAHLVCVLDKSLSVYDFEHSKCHCASCRMTACSPGMREATTLARKSVVYTRSSECRTHWKIATGQPLGNSHDVGIDSPTAAPEPRPQPPEARGHFIHDEQNAMPPCDLTHESEIFRRKWDDPTNALHWLEDNRGNGLRAAGSNSKVKGFRTTASKPLRPSWKWRVDGMRRGHRSAAWYP